MPGTINVSVLEFKDLPSSSPSSSISVKVAMGKRESERAGDKGEFSFPMTTLRENVSITLKDSQGNEILHKGVQTMLVAEKGSWDEFLPLEGGGQVHLKLQFVLSEEERNRIRLMRESAMRKKKGELLSSSSKWSENVSSAGGIVMSSLPINYEVSDSRNRVIPKAMSVGDLLTHAETLSSPECTAQNKEKNVQQTQLKPDDTDGLEETSSSASILRRNNKYLGDVHHSYSVEKIETNIHHFDVRKRPVLLQEASSSMNKTVTISKLKNHQEDQLQQNPLEKTPSNVRKMISAFEGSLAKDTRPDTEPPVADIQAAKEEMEASKDLKSKIMAKAVKLTSGRLKNPFLTEELQQVHTHARKSEEHIVFDETLPKSKSSGNAAKHEMRKPNQDLVRLSAAEAATVLGSSHKEHLSINEQDTAVTNRHGSRVHTQSRNSHEISMQRTLEVQLKVAAFCENELSSESSGAWIFPDHTRRLCMTTGSKQIMELVGVPGIQERTHKGKKSFSLSEKVEKFGNYNQLTKDDKNPHELRKSEPGSTAGVENSTGPIGQAIKVAIMVAFGTLVLLTRQRKP
ncbi:hypothetical protein NMG60_11021980 [Bertholletia excelsa]